MRGIEMLRVGDVDLAVKSVGRDTIRGYVVLWGNPTMPDLSGDYFTPETDFWDSVLGMPRPLTLEHAQDPETKAAPVIGSIVEFGDDEIGRWYVAQLKRNHEYRRAVDALIAKRALGTSSDSAPQYVERQQKGAAFWIKRWPLLAASLTVTPCEGRMFDAGSLYWKSIGVDVATRMARTGGVLARTTGPDGLVVNVSDVAAPTPKDGRRWGRANDPAPTSQRPSWG